MKADKGMFASVTYEGGGPTADGGGAFDVGTALDGMGCAAV